MWWIKKKMDRVMKKKIIVFWEMAKNLYNIRKLRMI